MSPVSPFSTRPGVSENASQTLGPRPSSAIAPSIWYEAVAAPQTKSSGNRAAIVSFIEGVSFRGLGRRDDRAADEVARPQLEQRRRRVETAVDSEGTAVREAATDVRGREVPVRTRGQLRLAQPGLRVGH